MLTEIKKTEFGQRSAEYTDAAVKQARQALEQVETAAKQLGKIEAVRKIGEVWQNFNPGSKIWGKPREVQIWTLSTLKINFA